MAALGDKASASLARRIGPALLAFCLLLLGWESYARLSGIPPAILPPPSRVVAQAVEHRGALLANATVTLRATLLGFGCSLSLAFILSVVVDSSERMRRALFPVFVISQTLPLVAIAPLVVFWFGFGLAPKVMLVALVTFFPMLVALAEGYRSTDVDLEALLASMGASRSRIFLLARFPSALPFFFAGLKVSITYAVVGAIFAEYAGAAKGLGIFILNAKNNFRPDLVLAAVLVSAALTLLLYGATFLAERVCTPWTRPVGKAAP